MAGGLRLEKSMDEAPAHERPRASRRVFPASGRRIALEAALAAVAALVIAAILYKVWNVRWAVPIYEDGSDARAISSQLKTIDETGWWVHNPKLGWPYGQFHADFPSGGESLQLLVLKVLMWLTPGYGQTINLYYLGGFGVLAAVTFLVIRHLGFAFGIAFVFAIAYTFLPYHFAHAQDHLHRSAYFSAPLGGLLLLWALSWRTRFLSDPDPPPGVRWRSNLRRGPILAAIAIAVVVGVTETMATAFTMALLGASAIVAVVRWREPQRLLVAGALIVVLAGSFFVVSLPSIVRIAQEGKNPVAGVRDIANSESYSIKISRLLFPGGSHRFQAWGNLGNRVQVASTLPTDGGQYIGVLGVVGFVGGLILLLTRGLRGPPRRDPRPPDDREALEDHAALLMTLCLLLGTVAGFSTILGLLGFAQVRTWDRIVMFIALFAFLLCAIWFERLGERIRARLRRSTPVLALLAAAVLAFVLWDTLPTIPRDYPALTASWVSDQRFVSAIDDRMPTGAGIFQLPIVPYPETRSQFYERDYDLFRGYLHDDGSLNWSYGAVKGRPKADWQLQLRDRIDPVSALPALLGIGYDGLWVDSYAYVDKGARIRAKLQQKLGAEPLQSENGRLLFWDLRPYKARLGRSDAELAAITKRVLGFDPKTGPPGA
jgi:hypothetical protein